ncbi:MAG: ROK family protein [Vicinamibacterales bacterium]
MSIVAGIDLGGTAINYTFVDASGRWLIEGLCEHPARATDGPQVCLRQIADGFEAAGTLAGIRLQDVVAVGLDTPGPATADGVLSEQGSTNFVHADWAGFDIRTGLEGILGRPVAYLNDGNAGALWGHVALLGAEGNKTSISAIIGTGLGGGVIVDGSVVKGRKGFGGELGHVLLPYQSVLGTPEVLPQCNCGRIGDLESLCSLTAIANTLLPFFLARYPGHELAHTDDMHQAAKLVRGRAERGDPMCREIFRVQARALGFFFDAMINTFDPDALIVGGGALETGPAFQEWFIDEIRLAMPAPREEQADIPIHVMPNGDAAGARGAAIEALKLVRRAAQSTVSSTIGERSGGRAD